MVPTSLKLDIFFIPLLALVSEFQLDFTELPSGFIVPNPVTTTRLNCLDTICNFNLSFRSDS